MSARQDRDSVVKALNQGALGFIPKSVTRKIILGAVQLVISGGVYIPPQALPGKEQASSAPAGMAAARPAVLPYRSNRQLSE
jgi:DNA-binding NarL/FixJ family response regulator